MFSVTAEFTEAECEAAFMNSSIILDFNHVITLLVLVVSFTSLAKNFSLFMFSSGSVLHFLLDCDINIQQFVILNA